MHKKGILGLTGLILATFGVQAQAPDPDSIAPMIINGDHADVTNYPYFASLYFDRISDTGYYVNICGATVYNQDYILTAAHCVDQSKDSSQNLFLKVAVGVQYEQAGIQGGYDSSQSIAIKEIYRHPSYIKDSDDLFPNDIALVKLVSPMPEHLVKPADYVINNLPLATTYRAVKEPLRIIGHGKSTPVGGGYIIDDSLQLEQANVLYTDSCKSHGSTGDKKICITSEQQADNGYIRYKSACAGDSGGPLLWFDGAKYLQVGVASYAAKDCGAINDPKGKAYNYASAYTEVLAYKGWIDQVLSSTTPYTPSFVVTESARAAYKSSLSNESGGPLGSVSLFAVLLAAIVRRKRLV